MPIERPIQGLIFDIDGVLLRGPVPVPGAIQTLRALAAAGYRLGFLSNDSMSSAHACALRLARHGFPATEATAVTAAVVAARFARTHLIGRRVLVVGMPAMRREFLKAGVEVVALERWTQAEALVMGRDETFSYRKLVVLMRAVQRLGAFYATGLDARLPVGNGEFVPGAGAMVMAVAHAAGVQPQVLGKPSSLAAQTAAAALGLDAAAVAMVGDSPTQDIAMGTAAGMHTVLVLTGSTSRQHAERLHGLERPGVVLPSVANLPAWLSQTED
jgi:HAD superfamily hydrolase (TIGR01450 family)